MGCRIKRTISIALCLAMLLSVLPRNKSAAAPMVKTFVLEQAQRLALSADDGIKKKANEIFVKQMKYVEAVTAIKAKVKNLRSFRWTPLLSFKLPQELDLIQDYDLTVKPLTLQSEITTLLHEKNDMIFDLNRRVTKLFIEIYVGQETILFSEKMIAAAEAELARNEAKLLLGTAKQADIDTMQKALDTMRSDLALAKRTFENNKANLSDMLKIDITTGYVFKNPLKTVDISREQLEKLVEYTLENDHIYYAARMAESVAKLNLDSYEKLFRNKYGAKVNVISMFLNQARRGSDIDKTAFKQAYDNMLKSFDKPWDGKVKILFFTFTMEWLKFEQSGTRYVEDEMYALYTAALDYLAAYKDKLAAEKALRKQIAVEYESLVTAKNAVDSMLSILSDTRAALNRMVELNRIGKAEYTEVKDKQTDYQDQQMDAVELLATYNELLYDFDRLTCGAVTKLMAGAGLDLDAGEGGMSNVDLPTYHIYLDVADLVFAFSIQIPEDFEPAIDSFEIWYEGTQIGARTPADKTLRHLALDYGESSMLTVRLFEGDEYIDECEIDTTVPTDVLKILGSVLPPVEERTAGYYEVTTQQRGGASTVEIKLTMLPEEPAKYYRISMEGTGLFTGEPTPVTEPFKYLALLSVSIGDVRVELLNESKELLYTARFEASDRSLRIINA